MPLFDPADPLVRRRCNRCGTELAPLALACPSCATLVHRARLKELSDLAAAAGAAGDSAAARERWQEALTLVPHTSEQHRQIAARIDALREPAQAPAAAPQPSPPAGSWWKQAAGAAVTVGVLLIGKLKFLLLGLTKASTFISMFGFMAVYWGLYGWPLALGLVISIYIHEMGHVAMLRRLGIAAGAPLFIPGVGAVVMLKERITDPLVDARIGLAGPLWGMGAAIAAWLVWFATSAPIWLAISELTAFINLFNLVPVWQLDGSRGFHALSRTDRWLAVGTIGVMVMVTGLGLLWIVGAVALWRAIRSEPGPGHTPTLLTYQGLVVALTLLARNVH
ncbi:MAG TPA: site-2 protease family protein [Vicinamibacterales bacterium]|nr:site-2 protease family protein [Vicinamibacterales bacterium]